MSTRLSIDTQVQNVAESSARSGSRTPADVGLYARGGRLRKISNASTSSSLSIISPTSSSTNASTTSLPLPSSRASSRSRSPSPAFGDVVHPGPEFVLAMHDYEPELHSDTCLSFREGQVIRVINRDPSGWWDGELDGRRGWFPSNFVNARVTSLTEEELPEMLYRTRHNSSKSAASATSWVSSNSSHQKHAQHHSESSVSSVSGVFGPEIDAHCPPVMVPLLHGLSLLQNAVRANRIGHFQPSTACIISCVRTILATTETLPRDAPILRRFSVLAEERARILSVLASLVAQAKKASEENVDDETRSLEIGSMLRLGGQVFANVRRFLAVAIQCGVILPEDRELAVPSQGSPGSSVRFARNSKDDNDLIGRTPTQNRQQPRGASDAGSLSRIKSMGDLEKQSRNPLATGFQRLPSRETPGRNDDFTSRDITPGRHLSRPSVGSLSSSSSFSSRGSLSRSTPPPLPSGPATAAQVLETLRSTHDQYLSMIAAFIGHAHSHSRSSHASSTGHLYDLVREIVEMVCKLLMIVEAVMLHPDIPMHRLNNLRTAKEGLYNITSTLPESVRLLITSSPPTMSDDEEKQTLLRSATGALKAGADCVAAVKVCLNRSFGQRPFIINLTSNLESISSTPFTPGSHHKPTLVKAISMSGLDTRSDRMDDEDLTIQAQTPSQPHSLGTREDSSGSDNSGSSKLSRRQSDETEATSAEEGKLIPPPSLETSNLPPSEDLDLPSPRSFMRTDEEATTWEGSTVSHAPVKPSEEKAYRAELPSVPEAEMPEPIQDMSAWLLSHDYPPEDVAYNSEGHLVGATIDVLVEKMTPHDSIVDAAFSAVFFLTFRLFSSPLELVDAIIRRYNLLPPAGVSYEDLQLWQQQKGIPVRLRVSNFIKSWVEMYWRPGVDDIAAEALRIFTADGLSILFLGPAQRILDLLSMRQQTTDVAISPKADRSRDPGMSLNPPSGLSSQSSEIPRPTMTKTLLVALRKKDFATISITDFDAMELARQLTIMECKLYCAVQPEEVLEMGQEGAKAPVNVRAVSSLSTVITGWVAESVLNEGDLKKRTLLVKFFIKVADRCSSLQNYSTSRSILAALDSSTISRLHQTWMGVPQKHKGYLEALRRLADHSRNYREYRTKLRNTAPPAVPFLGLYLTDVTFCREGNPSHRASPLDINKKLLNFNKYHKLARIVQDMQRFQIPYNLKSIPEVQQYLNVAFENSKHHGDFQDLYRRSLLVEPKQLADTPTTSDMRQLFNWTSRSQSQSVPSSS